MISIAASNSTRESSGVESHQTQVQVGGAEGSRTEVKVRVQEEGIESAEILGKQGTLKGEGNRGSEGK